jgi:catechol 2,3-dioxygenase-like lactoylglutathione lyase family enzyme
MAFIRHLAFRCADKEKSHRFYQDVIGFEFVGYRGTDKTVDLTDGTLNITLIQQPPELLEGREQFVEGTEFMHFGLIVDDLEPIWRRLSEWGAEFARENVKERNPIDPAVRPPQSFKVLDPDGNSIDITCSREEWNGVTV